MINSLKKYTILGAIAVLIGAVASSCSEDDLFSPDMGGEGESYITFRCADMLEAFVGEHNPASRAGGSKTPEEKAINTLHVFFFDNESGDLLVEDTYSNFQPYQRLTKNTSMLKIPTGEGVSNDFKNNYKNVHIVAIANIDATDEADAATDAANKFYTEKYSNDGKIMQAGRNVQADIAAGEAGNNGETFEITNYSDLQKWVYYPRIRMNEDGTGDISKLPEAGMPMIGELRGVDLSQKPATTPIVNMQALMAKVTVSVDLQPDQTAGNYPLLKITGYGVRNMPIAVPFRQPTTEVIDGKGGKPTGVTPNDVYANYFEKYDVTNVSMFHKGDSPVGSTHFVCDDEAHEFMVSANVTINEDSDPVTFSYYTLENINLPDYNAKRANGEEAFNAALVPQYPTGVKEADKQRWKSTFAYSDRASALILKGEYTTHQGLTYNAQFTVYMGCTVGVPDPNIDFQVKRNHRYDNNIVIHGLDYIRNSEDEVYNFDGRVNVTDDNPFYLAIVNERKVDAHATALPMDVWFMMREDGTGQLLEDPGWDSEISFTVRNHETAAGNWIRMEKVTREEMAAGNFAPGTGARSYFTTDLVKGQTAGEKGELEDNWKMTIDGDTDGSRSRIYFYIDENVPTDDDGTNYGDRTAIIDIVYTRKEGGVEVDRRVRTLEIEQRALLPVTADGSVSWMEVYEEYLDHSDPLDPHNEYGEFYNDGLPWGLEGVNVNFGNPESGNDDYQVYNRQGAFAMTRWAVNRSDTDPLSNVKLFNTTKPSSAFHYCYGKNKRDINGNAVVTYNNDFSIAKGWYMPGIRELEQTFLKYYNDFAEFRGNYYWSCACAQKTATGQGNTTNDYARATMIIFNGTSYTYAESHCRHYQAFVGWVDAGPGFQLRTKKNRIRAFYRVN
ncbi:MAG: hypothetical protein K2K00_03780 [Muribaculaceae bacterium]|nr:hypothetical protein [Muribaculaceae bacterium]